MHGSILDAYVIQIQGQTLYVSGTSAATPSLASAMALVLENSGSAQGNANPVFYALANQQLTGSGAAVFHDIIGGNNSVPGVSGFNTGTGYDEATGLGSIDASLLVNHWSNGSNTNFTLAPSSSDISVVPGHPGVLTISVTRQSGFSSPVTLTSSGAPAGVTVKFSSSTIPAASPVTATFIAAAGAAPGGSIITITGSGGGLTHSAPIAVTVAIPDFKLTASATNASLTAGSSTAIALSTATSGGFHSTIMLSASGLPTGVTAAFAPASITSPSNGSSTLTLTAAGGRLSGAYSLTVSGAGGGVTKIQVLRVTVVGSSFTLALGGTQVTVSRGGSATITASTAGLNGFSSAITLTVSKPPKGVTVSVAPASIASPGSGGATLTLNPASNAAKGTSTLTVTGTGGGTTKTQTFSLTVQ
jgi:hypothetical protein